MYDDEEEEVEAWIYENCYNECMDAIDLRNLDFTRYSCDVYISGMKVDGTLHQDYQKAKKINQVGLEAKEIIMDDIDKFKIYTSCGVSTLTPAKKKIKKSEIEKILGYEIDIVEDDK